MGRSKVVKLGLVKILFEMNREAIQEDVGDVEVEDVKEVFEKFSLTVLEVYEGIILDFCKSKIKNEGKALLKEVVNRENNCENMRYIR